MKKHTLLYIVSLVLLTLAASLTAVPVHAQDKHQYALYNYRNDGNFNAFLNVDIDSITYSCVDLDGVEHDELVVQEVWTPDSLFRIPLDVIDSIGFRAPAPVMKEGLFYLREYHAAHTTAIDSLTLYFDDSILNDSLPSFGQVVLSTVRTGLYEEGFAGVVDGLAKVAGGVMVTCHAAEVHDIFKKLVMVGKVIGGGDEQSAARRAISETDLISNIPLPDIDLSLFEGILTIKSLDASVVCGYNVYVDELIYNISADVYVDHPDIRVGLNFKLSDLKKIGSSAADALYKTMTGTWGTDELKSNRQVLEECLTAGIPIPLVKTGVFNLTLKFSPLIKLSGDIELDMELGTTAKQHIALRASGYSRLAQLLNLIDPTIPAGEISARLKDFNLTHSSTPMVLKKIEAKIEGKVAEGFIVELEASLISKKVVHAAVGAEVARQLSGTLQFNIMDASTSDKDHNFYDLIKDSQIELKDYVKVKGDIGLTNWSYLQLSREKDISEDILGSYYAVPHFTEPQLPSFQYENDSWGNLKPLSLYSSISKDVLFSCKPGIKITDLEGNIIKEVQETDPYKYAVEWRCRPLNIDISSLTAGQTYRCYPTFSVFGSEYFNAGPYHEFEMPQPLSASPQALKLAVGESTLVAIEGGWDVFETVIQGDVATVVMDEDTYYKHFKVVAQKVGEATLEITDRRSGEVLNIPISVTEEQPEEPVVPEDPEQPATDERFLIYSNQVDDATYSLYKQADKQAAQPNYDGWVFYRSKLTLDVTKNGTTKTYDVADGLYLDPGKTSSQTQAMALDLDKKLIYIFSNSKTENVDYTMSGHFFISPLDNIMFSHEVLFDKANIGWFPYFTKTDNTLQLNHFSYAGYYAMLSELNTDGTWSTSMVGQIRPSDFEAQCKQHGSFVVFQQQAEPVEPETPETPALEAIDLGLPSGTLWANCNVGAKRPEDFGGFYAWGETFEKTDYSQADYTMYEKYTYSDGLTELKPEDDVATVQLGAPWHMPTRAQMTELINSCTWTWTTLNGSNGFLVQGPNGRTIFLPAAGTKADGSHNVANMRLTYWANAVDTDNTAMAYNLWSWETPPATVDNVLRWFGYSVRAVMDQEVDERVETVIPNEYREAIEEYVPIYDGVNPPNIEGCYYIDPQVLIGSSLSGDQVGKKYNYEYQKYSNQDAKNNTIDMIRVQGTGSEWAKGSGAFISGSGNNFTVYFTLKGESKGIPFVHSYFISGTKTAEGIKNMKQGFLMTEKGSDPDNKLVPVGTYRFFEDQDGMSEAAAWPYEGQYDATRRVKVDHQLPDNSER